MQFQNKKEQVFRVKYMPTDRWYVKDNSSWQGRFRYLVRAQDLVIGSDLGFRHGPKAVVDNRTLMVYLLSNNPYVQKYETDLIHAVNKNQKGIYRIALTEHKLNETEVDLLIQASCGEEIMPEEFWSICSVLPAQIIGFFKSINLGFKPDSPSESGTITRVVEGVNIYPYLRT